MLHRDEYLAQADAAAAALRSAGLAPASLVVQCGSGLSALTAALAAAWGEPARLPLAGIPHWPRTGVIGHGREALSFGAPGGRVLVVTGRVHLYEGHDAATAGFVAAAARACAAELLLLTNAAGALNQHLRTGDAMLIRDFINFQGDSPLARLEFSDPAERFVDPKPALHAQYSQLLGQCLQRAGFAAQRGVYVAVRGPQYETLAELAMLRSFGADAVGMSTLPEWLTALWLRQNVAAVSIITNECFAPEPVGHQSVLEASRNAAQKLGAAIIELAAGLPGPAAG